VCVCVCVCVCGVRERCCVFLPSRHALNLDDQHLLLCVQAFTTEECAIFAWDALQEGRPDATTISFSGLQGVMKQESVRIVALVNTYFLLLQPRATLLCRLDRHQVRYSQASRTEAYTRPYNTENACIHNTQLLLDAYEKHSIFRA